MAVKQVIVVRRDLKMRKGKIAAQASHASMKVFFDRIEEIYPDGRMHKPNTMVIGDITSDMKEWIEGIFTKVVVECDSEEELFQLKKKADDVNCPTSLIIDNGLTVFDGVKTPTCIAIGPARAEVVDEITGHLKLL
jgi:PTH2 family peptidyl-tRNA hydrolase